MEKVVLQLGGVYATLTPVPPEENKGRYIYLTDKDRKYIVYYAVLCTETGEVIAEGDNRNPKKAGKEKTAN